ncbi:MAG TPA: hypothetical protein VGT79_05705 [Xanthomonadaceae bacterium]|nr:hypothetical protein [Xanthomonadaceae bacterium]
MTSIFVCIALAAVAFAIGESMGQRSMLAAVSVQMDGTQTELAFNRLLDERHWKSLLAKGCLAQATKAIDAAEDEDMGLLAEFFKGKLDAATIKYVTDRDPNLVEQLKTFKSQYSQGWSEEECKG